MCIGIAGAAEETMLSQDYLNLRLVRLKGADQWSGEAEGATFVFPRAGAGNYLKGTSKQPLSPGDVLVLNEDSGARIGCGKGSEFAFSGFSLRIDHLFPLFTGIEISLLQTILDGLKGYRFYPASHPVASECHHLVEEIPSQFNLDHRGQCLRLAAAVLNTEFMTAHGKRVGFIRTEDHLIQVFESLSVDEMLHMSVPELAKRFSCSRRHLNRLFHHYFGYSVASLRMEMRLLKAVSLLRNCDSKVINVAEQCGFNHLGLFNTCFRKRFGTSPGQWRKTMSESAEGANIGNGIGKECPLRMTGLCPRPNSQPAKVESNGTSNGKTVVPFGGKLVRPPGRPEQKKKLPSPPGKTDDDDFDITIAANQKPVPSNGLQIRAQQ